jgi:dTDP-4-dehydrorhamnose 3,5-epimerase
VLARKSSQWTGATPNINASQVKITEFEIPGLLVVEPQRFGDERGQFCEIFKSSSLIERGFSKSFIQDNLARSGSKGSVRGLHMQSPPFAQDKLVRCSRGAIFDVAVDVRLDSPTFGRAVSLTLSAENWLQLLVPAGFAHGYCTLTEDCEVQYKVTAPYAPEAEEGLIWSDPALAINWPVAEDAAILNARDRAWPTLEAWASGRRMAHGGAVQR